MRPTKPSVQNVHLDILNKPTDPPKMPARAFPCQAFRFFTEIKSRGIAAKSPLLIASRPRSSRENGTRKIRGSMNMTHMEWSDWLLLFFLPLAAIASLALLILVVVPILFGAHLAIGYLNGERRHIRHITVTGGLRGFGGLLGWWLGACLGVEGPASLLLTFISLHDASQRKLLLPAVIGMAFAIAGFCLIRTSDKNDFKISWPAVHTLGSALRRAVLMRWLVWDWLPTTRRSR
jgi:hypothetical protein